MSPLWPYECGECGETFDCPADLADPNQHEPLDAETARREQRQRRVGLNGGDLA